MKSDPILLHLVDILCIKISAGVYGNKKFYFFCTVIFRPGPSLACSETMAMLFWRHTLHAFISFCCKVSPVKAEELMTEHMEFPCALKILV